MSATVRSPTLDVRAPSLKRFLAVAIAVPVLLLAVLLWLRSETVRAQVLRDEAASSFQRQIDLVALLSRLKDAETAQRGYVITHNPAFLAPFEPARRDIAAMITNVRSQPDSNTPAAYFDRMDRLARAKLDDLDRAIALERAGRADEAKAIVAAERGRRYMDALRQMIGAEIAHEDRRLSDRRSAFQEQREDIVRFIVVAFALFSIALLVSLAILWRVRNQRYDAMVAAFEAATRKAAILSATVDAILIIDPDGRIYLVNAAATRMIGYELAEIEGRDLSTIIDLAPGEGSFHQRVGLHDGRLARSYLADRTARHRDGRLIPVDIAIGVMPQAIGDHLVVSLRDISERKRVERMKDELMSTVSHELRTPLTSVIGALGLLRSGSVGTLGNDAGRLVDIADNNARRLIRLINDMLDIDRIESGRMHIARDTIDLREIVTRAAGGSEGLAQTRSIAIRCDLPDRTVMVSGDADRLLQVVTNLLSNAIRAAPEGSDIDLSLGIQSPRDAIVRVEDRGAGIPPAFRERIFGRFERVADDTSAGTGLGLAISREIVARHDGRIWFEDRAGGGTCFCFSLPLLRDVVPRGESVPCVLICQQDPAVAAALSTLVEDLGCTHRIAIDVKEARAALAQQRYAAVLVDLDLPDGGGVAFAKAARDGDDAHDLPMLLVATSERPGHDLSPPIDAIDWIGASVDPARLTQALQAALTRTRSARPVVLHLDDDHDLLEVVTAALDTEVEIVSATNLTAARAVLRNRPPDAVILDIRLAEGVGTDLLPLLTDRAGRAIPTIIYSGEDVPADLAAQVDAVLVKARGSIPDLKATLRRIVRQPARKPDQP